MDETTSEIKDFFIDLAAGAIAGVTMVTSGQPFDTIKVRMQMSPIKVSMTQTIKDIYLREGFLSYYKGITAPLSASLPVSSALFASYETYMRFMDVRNRQDFIPHHWLLGGGFSGFVQAFIICPSELLKCVLQMQFEYLPKKYKSPIECIKSFWRDEGLRGLFKGFVPTLVRDIPQYAVFFTTFEVCKYFCLKKRQSQEMTFFESFAAGGLAGFLCIVASYPQVHMQSVDKDLIKTKVQCEVITPPFERIYSPTYCDGGTIKCARSIFKSGGYKGFWMGFNSCSVYYMVTCSVQFATYETTKEYLQNFLYPNIH